MTTEHWLRVIVANPDEDTPRQEFADWLDENPAWLSCRGCQSKGFVAGTADGPNRIECVTCGGRAEVDVNAAWAKFIRAQFDLTTAPRSTADDYGHVVTLEDRIEGLFDKFARSWFPDLFDPTNDVAVQVGRTGPAPSPGGGREPPTFTFEVRKGFPEVMWCPLLTNVFPSHAWTTAGFVARHPIREVRYTDRHPANTRKRSGRQGGRVFAWFASSAGGSIEHVLPTVLMPDPSRRRCNYGTEEKAWAAASRRALEYLRGFDRRLVAFGADEPINEAGG